MFSFPDDDSGDLNPDALETLLDRTSESFDNALEAIGVYVRSKALATTPLTEHSVLVIVTAQIGRVAFSDRVLYPERAQDAETLEHLEEDMVDDDARERIALLQQIHAAEAKDADRERNLGATGQREVEEDARDPDDA